MILNKIEEVSIHNHIPFRSSAPFERFLIIISWVPCFDYSNDGGGFFFFLFLCLLLSDNKSRTRFKKDLSEEKISQPDARRNTWQKRKKKNENEVKKEIR